MTRFTAPEGAPGIADVKGTEGVHTLSSAVRPSVVLRHLGDLLLGVAILNLAPLAVCLLEGELGMALGFLAAVLLPALLTLGARRLGVPGSLQASEGLVVVTLVFVISPLLMVWPFMAAGLAPSDAFFEAVSGFTTTGLSTLASVEHMPAAFLFARSWAQWCGGLVIVALSIALLVEPGIAARNLSMTEGEDLAGSVRAHARRMLGVYLVLTGIGFLALMAAGLAPFEALVHDLAAVSTGGFSSHDSSLGGLAGWTPRGVLILVSTLGAVSLPLYDRARRRGWKLLWRDVELRALVVLGLWATLILGGLMVWRGGASPSEALRNAPLMAFSAQTTTGFTSVAPADLDAGSRLVLIVAMLTGASAGSTGGGIKVLRLLIVLGMIRLLILRARLPRHAVVQPRLGGQGLSESEIQRAFLMVLLFAGVVLLSWFAFLLGGHDPMNSLFEVASATGTVGLSAGVTAPELSLPLKGVLCADMLVGRLEILGVLVVLSPGTWIGRRPQS